MITGMQYMHSLGPTLLMMLLNLRYQALGQMCNMDKRQHRHCFLSRAFGQAVMGQGKYDLRSSDNSDAHVPGSIPARASVRQVPVDNSRRFPTLPTAKLETFATKRSAKCATWIKGSTVTDTAFYPALLVELSWGKESKIYVPPTTPTLMSRVRYLPQSGRSRSTLPDDSRRFPTLPNAKPSLPSARPNAQHG